MKRRQVACVACVLALSAAGVSPAAAQSRPAGKAAQAPDLPRLIETIRTSAVPSEINDAYRDGRTRFPDAPDLHRAYMRRMLAYGMISLAGGAAEKLSRLDPYDGVAWALLTYVEGKAGRYGQALEYAVLAGRYEPDNPSVLAALGQLLAWQENTPKAPPLPEASIRMLAEYRRKLPGRQAFAAAHDAVAKGYAAAGEQRKDLASRIADLKATMQDADAEFRRLGRQLDDIARETDFYQRRIARSRDDLRTLTRPVDPPPIPGPNPPPPPPRSLTQSDILLREAIIKSIRADEDSIQALERSRVDTLRSREELRAKALKARNESNQLTAQLTGIDRGLAKLFRWDPPAVDGVVTPEKEYFPIPVAATTAPTSQDYAHRELKLAQLHVANGRADLARAKLQTLISLFPDTPVAKESQALLDTLPPGK